MNGRGNSAVNVTDVTIGPLCERVKFSKEGVILQWKGVILTQGVILTPQLFLASPSQF